ncbi:hypothetical protein OAU26_08925, partial [Mariniblastus sp.]|nr:hypothetical protein [Mariniblastus sp.]MDC3225044.1 hypothetical protein [Mariniblastus sp.]
MGQRNFPAPICAYCLACNEASTIHCDHLVCLALHIVRFHGTAVTVVTNDLTDQSINRTTKQEPPTFTTSMVMVRLTRMKRHFVTWQTRYTPGSTKLEILKKLSFQTDLPPR